VLQVTQVNAHTLTRGYRQAGRPYSTYTFPSQGWKAELTWVVGHIVSQAASTSKSKPFVIF